jgi:hypothetical protein
VGWDAPRYMNPGARERRAGTCHLRRMRVGRSTSEYECVVNEFYSREVFCVHHELERFNLDARTNRRDTHIRGRGRPYSETSPNQGDSGDRNRGVHLSSPVQIRSRRVRCQTYGFGRCDGHHEMVDLKLET